MKEKFCEETLSEAEEVVDPRYTSRYTSRYTIALPMGCNGFPMVSKKGQPALGPVGIPRRSFHPTRGRNHTTRANRMPQTVAKPTSQSLSLARKIFAIYVRFGLCFAKITTTFEMNNLHRGDVTL